MPIHLLIQMPHFTMHQSNSSSPLAVLSVGHLLNITDNDCTYKTIRTCARQSAWIKDTLREIFTAIMYLQRVEGVVDQYC